MKKLLCIFAIAVFALGAVISQASAMSLEDITGAVEFKLNGFTASQDTTYNASGETWGIFHVTSIQNLAGSVQYWSESGDNERIYGMLWGFTDYAISGSSPNVTVQSTGGYFAMWRDTDGNYAADYDYLQGVAGRIGVDEYNTISNMTGGELILAGAFAGGVLVADPNVTLVQNLNQATAPAAGDGSGYANITAGTLQSKFDTNKQLSGTDLYVIFDVNPASEVDVTVWDQYINDPTRGFAVPEPSTLLLLGFGLLGLAGVRRNRS